MFGDVAPLMGAPTRICLLAWSMRTQMVCPYCQLIESHAISPVPEASCRDFLRDFHRIAAPDDVEPGAFRERRPLFRPVAGVRSADADGAETSFTAQLAGSFTPSSVT
jgi:hypothetical protein